MTKTGCLFRVPDKSLLTYVNPDRYKEMVFVSSLTRQIRQIRTVIQNDKIIQIGHVQM